VTSTRARQDNALHAYRRVIELDAAYPKRPLQHGLDFRDRRDWQAAAMRLPCARGKPARPKNAQHMHNRVAEILNSPPIRAKTKRLCVQ